MGTRLRAGLSLLAASLAVAASAAVVSATCVVLRPDPGGDRALRVRVDLQLEAIRVVREISDLLQSSTPAPPREGREPEFAFRRPGTAPGGPDLHAFVLVPGLAGQELQLRAFDAAGALVSSRTVSRHLERISFETSGSDAASAFLGIPPAPDRVRITAWFRWVVDRKVYTARQACTVIRPMSGE